MFNSNVLEVGVGLVFSFLAVSLITGAIVEAISSATKWRSNNLLSGVKALLNDPNFDALASDLYAHAAINPRGPGSGAPTKNKPAYIDKNQFAEALMDITGMSAAIGAAAAAATAGPIARPAAPLVTALKGAVDTKITPPAAAAAAPAAAAVPSNPQIRQLLYGIIDRAKGDPDKIKEALGNWFDNGMDRLSGAYKRQTQLLSTILAFVLAVGLNVDSISIGKAVWEQPAIVANLKAPGQDKSPTADQALQTLDKTLPIGWPHGMFMTAQKDAAGVPMKDTAGNPVYVCFGKWDLLVSMCGWLLTTIATLFGAPFWFDALQTITRLKGAGPSPDDKKNKAAAST